MGMSEPSDGRKSAARSIAPLTFAILLSFAGPLSAPVSVVAQEFVAGTAPDRRPLGAPRVDVFTLTPELRAKALRGVSKPVPPSLRFVEDQGGWFTPFTQPNMPPPYDIRELYPASARGPARAR